MAKFVKASFTLVAVMYLHWHNLGLSWQVDACQPVVLSERLGLGNLMGELEYHLCLANNLVS